MKILIDHDTKQAFGVKYWRNGKIYKVFSSREVILSAGALNSPQLLMLSGLGPEDHLKHHGVPVLVHLPGVGRNLQDHYGSMGLVGYSDEPIAIKAKKINIENQ